MPKYVVLDFLADLFAENKEVDDDGFTRGRGVLNQDAWDRCQGHSLAAQEREYWPQYVEALRNGPKSLWDVSMAVYGTGNPQSGAIGVLLLAGVLSCKGNNKLSGDAWLKAVICKLKPEALA